MTGRYTFWGVFLISLGSLIMLHNYEIIFFDDFRLLQFWPLLLIIWGITLFKLPELVKIILAGLSGFALSFVVMSLFYGSCNFVSDNVKCTNLTSNYQSSDTENTKHIVEFDTTIERASLNFSGGIGSFSIVPGKKELLTAISRNVSSQISSNRKDDKSIDIDYSFESSNINISNRRINRYADIYLNKAPIWDINIQSGASSLDFDLSTLKVESVDIETGASDVMLKIGDLRDTVRINVESGLSNIEIFIPDNYKHILNSDASLSSISTENTHNSNIDNSKVIIIDLEAGLSNVELNTYSVSKK